MGTTLTARNTSQNKPLIKAVGRLVITTTNWYECPVGKKAEYEGFMFLDNGGAAGAVWISLGGAGGQVISTKIIAAGNSTTTKGSMVAGDILGYDQDMGNNATVDGNFTILEYPA